MGEDTKAERDVQQGTQASDSRPSIGFAEPLWGKITRDLVEVTQNLTEEHWEEIMEECKPYLPGYAPEGPGHTQLNEDPSNRGNHWQRSGLHSSIQIDW